MSRDVVLIDNFDSFSYNLAEEFSVLGCRLSVFRNTLPIEELAKILSGLHNPLLVLSPGPGAPEQAGNCIAYLRELIADVAILGICLGHQAMVVAAAGVVARAPRALHGERSRLHVVDDIVFSGLPSSFLVGRYHSLVATQLPDCYQQIAYSDDLCMAIRHRQHAAVGMQFHPESILTTHGRLLLQNIVTHLHIPGAPTRHSDREACHA